MALVVTLASFGCSGKGGNNNNQNTDDACRLGVGDVPVGDPDGHADPLGARAAGEARAARILEASWIVQPQARQRVLVGDFLLINDRIAIYIEDGRHSDGYAPFGGEIGAVDRVGEDGRPMGLSRYGETLTALSSEMLEPHSVTVLADGSDGGEAVVRVVGIYRSLPFMEGSLEGLLSEEVGIPGYIDYRLAPGEARLRVRYGLLNNRPSRMDLSLFQLFGFFHYSRMQKVTARSGYDDPKGSVDWVAFDGGDLGFLFRQPGATMSFAIEQSGFALFLGRGPVVEGCTFFEDEYFEIIAGGPELDGLLATFREEEGDTSWRPIQGTLVDSLGARVAGAWIHVLDDDGLYLTRTRTDSQGVFLVHAPQGVTVTVKPQLRGYPHHEGAVVEPGEGQVDLVFGATGHVSVTVSDASTLEAIPSRIQVIPADPLPDTPTSHGVLDERGGRIHQHFDLDGEALLQVPTGAHRVVVSRGYSYDLVDTQVVVDATEPAPVQATLVRSVDMAGYLCVDPHVHTHWSPDSNDAPEHKVAGMVADGIDFPLFSDHEWVSDPQPIVDALGLGGIVRGITSLEVTTWVYGHFNVFPLVPQPDQPNMGAVDWVGLSPEELFAKIHSRPEFPLIIANHPRAMSVGGYFSAAGLNRETLTGNELWSDQFDLLEAFNGSDFESNRTSTVADWFAFLNGGRKLVVVGSSDNHHLRTGPAGYPRTCAYLGHDEPAQASPADLQDALLSGNVFVSGGLYVNISGPGGERLGETIFSDQPSVVVTVTVQAASWVPSDTLEIFVDGEITYLGPLLPDHLHSGPGKRYRHEVSVPVPGSGSRSWVVAHATGSGGLAPLHPGKPSFGVTNPIYIELQE